MKIDGAARWVIGALLLGVAASAYFASTETRTKPAVMGPRPIAGRHDECTEARRHPERWAIATLVAQNAAPDARVCGDLRTDREAPTREALAAAHACVDDAIERHEPFTFVMTRVGPDVTSGSAVVGRFDDGQYHVRAISSKPTSCPLSDVVPCLAVKWMDDGGFACLKPAPPG
ncbi:MAG TPA: hypothetical protein VGM88_08670 [Kofleriaceae bacterium]|jgi:hypothetical protein